MKKIYFLFLLFFLTGIISLKAQTQLPNPDFENWVSSISAYRPLNYFTVDTLGLHSCFKSTDMHGGTFAAKLRSLDTTILITLHIKLPGIATLGRPRLSGSNLSQLSIDEGIPFTDKPDDFIGYYKYRPINTDTMSVFIYFWRYNAVLQRKDTMGKATFSNSATINTYTMFDMPIQWNTSYSGSPDSMNLILLASHTVQNHTYAYFDDFSFYYDPFAAIATNSGNLIARVYPNPVKDIFTVELPELRSESNVCLFNLQGQLLIMQTIYQQKTEIDINSLAKGVYIIKVFNGEGVEVIKFVKD